RHKLKYQVPLSMGVGGAFDMISEIIPRAPVWLRKIGLEWLWRFYKQPSRWKRIHRAVIRFPSAVINSKNK
ncbi:MAG: acetylglucosaminyldiphospho-UDP acetyl-beta-D-mannosaminyltransferase, partial [Candidatus Nealsonbacteria bacterium CG23_combo_of_CG06-09_8_20_14_all_40_13]